MQSKVLFEVVVNDERLYSSHNESDALVFFHGIREGMIEAFISNMRGNMAAYFVKDFIKDEYTSIITGNTIRKLAVGIKLSTVAQNEVDKIVEFKKTEL